MDYVPHSEQHVKGMLETCNVKNLIDLFDTIPQGLLIPDENAGKILKSGALHMDGLTEFQLHASMTEMAARNKHYRAIFTGAGFYHHYIPAVVDYLASRGEFWTAYTPYQAERSQGYLQLIFEYQSLIAGLLGMNFSNASLHDGATALADAIAMAQAQNKKRQQVLVVGQLNPVYKKVLDTTFLPRSISLKETIVERLELDASASTMAVIVCSPDFYGNILDVERITSTIKQKDPGIICIQVIQEALSLALLKPPGKAGIDI
nr:glycine dehydrogenase [Candidatus Sigynarchaeota archaeon]